MHPQVILRILGLLLMLFSVTMLTPIFFSLLDGDATWWTFIVGFLITFFSGLVCWLPVYKTRGDLRTRDGFLITALFWIVLGVFGCLPLLLADQPDLSVTDAIFESISGLTTTGATVITGLDELPRSILYYRQQLQWLGGIGIIVIAVAILPMLGIGGMQLYKAETPGPMKDSKLTPRITETAKALFYLYLGFTLTCAFAYWAAGMNWFDALCHSYSTVAIGGFSTHDESIGYFNNPWIMVVGIFFMSTAGVNFALHYYTWRRRTIVQYFSDPEFTLYFFVLLIAAAVCCFLLFTSTNMNIPDSILHGAFQVISIATTTGFATTDFSMWPGLLPFGLLFLSCMGGCAGSTAGGIKVIRIHLIWLQAMRELKQLIHPNAIIPVKIKKQAVSEKVISAVWSFFAIYTLCFIALLLLIIATGLDFTTSFSAVAAMMNNLGPGLGEVSAHYGDINAPAKWILCFAMLLGRLEIFTLLVLFSPYFWRK